METSHSSDWSLDLDHVFLYDQYPALRRSVDPVYGVDSPEDVVLRSIDYDNLCYLLHSPGTHLVLFGGVWSETTQTVIGKINALARRHGVGTLHLFDFSPDGTEKASIKRDLTEQPDYDGPDKGVPNDFAVYNYLYGELVTRHLTNLNDWVARRANASGDITYLNVSQDAVSVANLREPFLFLFNRDNTVDHSGQGRNSGRYPIVWAAELTGEEDCAKLEEQIFCHIGENGETTARYDTADYIREAFRKNQRGHSFKTQDAFTQEEPIHLHKVPFQVFHWLLGQEGPFVMMFAGPWCAYSQGAVATVNDFAVANHLRVYMTDIRLDSKHPIDFWGYPRRNELTLSCPPMRKYYVEIWEEYLTGAEISCAQDPHRFWSKLTLDYVDEQGREHHPLSVGVPYLFSYDRSHIGARGYKSPILASRHGAYELINCSEDFIYHDPNYRDYRAGVYRVVYKCLERMGRKMQDPAIDRTAPLAEGEPVRHRENPAQTKEHNWYLERADRVRPAPGPVRIQTLRDIQ